MADKRELERIAEKSRQMAREAAKKAPPGSKVTVTVTEYTESEWVRIRRGR